ncbi:MAG: hypothetical protein JWO77_166 [Ilumatobacteraceae bacterium]|nr:hypothetical protein [Ilumatobacteraceae bacterium]
MTDVVPSATAAPAVVVSPAPRAAWSACYEADPTALPTQSPAWLRAMEATGDWRDASRHYSFADGTELVLPLVQRRGPMGPLSRSSMPDAWGFGGVVGVDPQTEHLAAVIEDLREIRTGWVRIRPNPLHADRWAAAAGRGAASTTLMIPKRAHVLTLDRPADEIFQKRFTSSCRRAVRSAEKAGLEVEVDSSTASVAIFHDLLMRSVDRWAGSQHEPLALARWRANRRDPQAKFAAWAAELDGGCRVLVARRAGTPIAAMIVLQGHNAHMTRSAMDKELVGHDRPNELLMWHAIRDAVEAGCGAFHLGESGTSVNLSRYKEKYGAVGTDYAEHRIEHLPATRVDRAARSTVKRIVGFRG